jgi:UDP-N-acetylmuramyl pentapeptide phosphotransferase/UDP-N-acetylglucosamine-1-phosphate transferase
MSYWQMFLSYGLVFLVALATSYFTVPRIILIAKLKKLYDLPDNNRKIHKEVVPNLGGIAIFFSTMIIGSFFVTPTPTSNWWHYIVASSLILFIIGLKDDILVIVPYKKFLIQLMTASIAVFFADIRLHSLHGILGIYEMPYWLSCSFSIIGITFVTNAFNLIDGVDGLAGTISLLCTLTLGVSLAFQGDENAAKFSFALMGALAGFLWFNRSPAKIFMGDSGSLFLGFSISILCILFINSFVPHRFFSMFVHSSQGALIIALAILFIPVFDSFRVFITRIAHGKHPFHADRIHLHHYLLDLGFNHNRVVSVLFVSNLLIIFVSLLVQDLNPNIGILAIVSLTIGLFLVLFFLRKRRLQKIEAALKEVSSRNDQIYLNVNLKTGIENTASTSAIAGSMK